MKWVTCFFVLCFLPSSPSYADCRNLFGASPSESAPVTSEAKSKVGEIKVIRSGRDREEIGKLQEAIEELFFEGGVADRLGIKLPPHVIEFVSSHDIAVLASLGRHAIGHALEGAELLGSLAQVRGVLEFVTPGCPTCRSYYKDTTSFVDQVSILMHVIGHNDFAENSLFNRMRNEDPIARSMQLYEKFEAVKAKYGHNEASRFFHYLKSLDYLQDVQLGTYDPPSEFGVARDPSSKRKNYPTRSVLQAMVNNLPRNAPDWQRDLISLYERMTRVYGYMANQKIMNEGWATLMQHILVEHSQWHHSGDILNFASLMAGVAGRPKYPNGGGWNPYWLGLECWKRVRARFDEEHADVPKLERDRMFIQHAHGMIAEMNDARFIRYALDETWVTRHGLYLSRATQYGEEREINEQPKPGESQQYVVVTDDPKRVVSRIAVEAADKRLRIPVITIKSNSGLGRNVVELVQEDFLGIPMNTESVVKTLYVLAQVYQRPVSLECKIALSKTEEVERHLGPFGFMYGGGVQEVKFTEDVRVIVDVNGALEIHRLSQLEDVSEGGSRMDIEFESALQAKVDHLKTDLWASYPKSDQREAPIAFVSTQVREEIVQHIAQQVASFSSHAPTAPKAIAEYQQMVRERMDRILKLLMSGQTPHRITSHGLVLEVMPDVPSFKYDHESWQELMEKEASPVEHSFAQSTQDMRLLLAANSKDIDTDLGQGGGRRKGDRFWGPPKNKDGQGKGKGKPGKPGEPGEEDGPQAGEQPGKSVLIPFEYLGKFLEEQIELPNLRRLRGKDPRDGDILMGGVHNPEGEILYERMIPDVLALGKLSLEKKGVKNPTKREMLEEGMKLTSPDDHIVPDRHPDPDPEINAVVVFQMDKSGSMGGRPFELAREFMFILKTLLRQKYKHVDFRFVGFTTVGREEPEATFFQDFMNGGTKYDAGIEMVSKILEKYPEASFDRFVFTVGDFDCFSAERSINSFDALLQTLQYAGFIYTPNSFQESHLDSFPKIYDAMGKHIGGGKVGRAILSDRQGGAFPALKKVFEQND